MSFSQLGNLKIHNTIMHPQLPGLEHYQPHGYVLDTQDAARRVARLTNTRVERLILSDDSIPTTVDVDPTALAVLKTQVRHALAVLSTRQRRVQEQDPTIHLEPYTVQQVIRTWPLPWFAANDPNGPPTLESVRAERENDEPPVKRRRVC